jgi:hypothetical protein
MPVASDEDHNRDFVKGGIAVSPLDLIFIYVNRWI